MNIPIEVSARHTHLSLRAVEILFGKNYVLTPKKNLSQPGQFACEERVDIIGPKGALKHIAVLAPIRQHTQVEVSITDAIKLGITGVIRESGDLLNTPGCILEGPCGRYEIKEGLIVSKRHIHITPLDAKKLNVHNGEIVSVKIDSLERSLIYNDVVIRINEKFALAMHIDTDEANALNYSVGLTGKVLKSQK